MPEPKLCGCPGGAMTLDSVVTHLIAVHQEVSGTAAHRTTLEAYLQEMLRLASPDDGWVREILRGGLTGDLVSALLRLRHSGLVVLLEDGYALTEAGRSRTMTRVKGKAEAAVLAEQARWGSDRG